ncbi:MAG: type II secretion system protein GspD [Candidatus Omnitrophica bacterium]|nr:type II secretion system protein GspD [Candidatus Omnitrophota bacterium]MCB9722013.1 type II secretion system protein GspD [Candidatus Omnitrophota bacterium]
MKECKKTPNLKNQYHFSLHFLPLFVLFTALSGTAYAQNDNLDEGRRQLRGIQRIERNQPANRFNGDTNNELHHTQIAKNGQNGKAEINGTIDISKVKASYGDSESEMMVFDVLNVKEMDILDLIKIISQKSDLNIIVSPNVSGKVTVYLKNVEVFEALKSIIESYNLAFLRTGNIINIMTAEEYLAKYRSAFGQEFETRILRLEDAKIGDVVALLNQVKSMGGKVVADDKTSTLILTDEPHVLDEMENIVNWVDGMVVTEIFELVYAEAEDIAAKIAEELTPDIGSIRTDKRSNKVIVSDTADKLNEIRQMVRAFDNKDLEVLIEAKIVQVTLSDEFKLGVDWEKLMVEHHNFNLLSNFDVLQSTDKRGQLSIGTLERDDYSVMVQALETIGETNILSSPSIATLNNEEAKIIVGSTEPYVTSTTTTPASGPTTTAESVNFIEVGVKLFVTPTIHRDDFITMKVKPEISSVTRNVITSNNNSIPVVETSEAETTVTVKDGVTIFIGGLIRDETINAHNKVPVLGSIPVIGAAFRGQDDFVRKTETVIFLSPKIITGDVPARTTYLPRERVGVISPEPSRFFKDSHQAITDAYEQDIRNGGVGSRAAYSGGSNDEYDMAAKRWEQPRTSNGNEAGGIATDRIRLAAKAQAAQAGDGNLDEIYSDGLSGAVLGSIRRVNKNLTFVIIHLSQSTSLMIGEKVNVYRDSEYIASLEVTRIRGELVAATITDQKYDIKVGDIIK